MKTKKAIIADYDVCTGVETATFFQAVYKTPEGIIRGKCYMTEAAAEGEVMIYCDCFKYELSYISRNLLFLR